MGRSRCKRRKRIGAASGFRFLWKMDCFLWGKIIWCPESGVTTTDSWSEFDGSVARSGERSLWYRFVVLCGAML